MTMTLADLDRDLERYRSAADIVSVNLLELDGDPNRQLLETAPLTGTTAREWADARSALASVWDWFARFTSFLDRAAELRVSPRTRLAPERERSLADFLSQASIELGSDEVPLRDRDLLQQRRATTHCTADELLDLMSNAFARAREVVGRVGTAWDELAPRIARARAALTDVDAAAHATVSRQIDALADALVTDPLAVSEAAVGDIETSVAALTRASAEAVAQRAQWPRRLQEARDELARVEQQVAVARVAHATIVAKILDPAVPDPPAVDDTLVDELDHVTGLADAGRWDDALAGLEQLRQALRRRADAAATSTTTNRAPMIERDRLRGLLDAYRAKAHGLDLDEDDDVTAAYERAQGALYAAPTDLGNARRLVERYQRLLTTHHEPEGRR
jgi:hypothetical protein